MTLSKFAAWKGWNRPEGVAALWILATLLHVVSNLLVPEFVSTPFVSSFLYLSAAPVLAALIASAVADLRLRSFRLASALLVIDCAASLTRLAALWVFGHTQWAAKGATAVVSIISFVASLAVAARALDLFRAKRLPRSLALLSVAVIVGAAPFVPRLDTRLYQFSMQLTQRSSDDDAFPEIDSERLWTSQPTLVGRSISAVDSTDTSGARTFLLTIGANGSQQLFGREARYARDILGHAFGAERRSILLANDEASLYRTPLADNTNLDAVLAGVGRRMNPAKDSLVVYLTSHGSREAELTTDLPNYDDLEPISAQRLADSLDRVGIHRRVVIVSACYSGTWIYPLASDDTIIVTAARADRTSFGCSDERQLTYFGEAFLKGPLAKGASLKQSFEATRKTVAEWEGTGDVRHSEPQAYVGKDMTAIWTKSLLSSRAK